MTEEEEESVRATTYHRWPLGGRDHKLGKSVRILIPNIDVISALTQVEVGPGGGAICAYTV